MGQGQSNPAEKMTLLHYPGSLAAFPETVSDLPKPTRFH